MLACALSLGLAAFALGWWHDPWSELNAELRLLCAAAAVAAIVGRGAPLPTWLRCRATDAVALACVAAFACIAFLSIRDPIARNGLPANAIVWALAVAFFLSLLAPMTLSSREASLRRRRCWAAAGLLGAAAILLSQSRGALVIFPWVAWLLVARWRSAHGGRWPWARMAALAAAGCLLLAAAWLAPGDPLRMRVAERDIASVERSADYNTSMGTRLYLWGLAGRGIAESPWFGIGQQERERRIHDAGDDLPAGVRPQLSYVRTMGHVHNEYLNAMLDGGIAGLGAILVLLAGLLILARKVGTIDLLAAQQLRGVTLVHATAGLTNVNFAHNYYVVMLALVVGVVVLGGAFRGGGGGVGLSRD